jgi:hypothetical protein
VLSPLHLNLAEQEAAKEFAGARKKALLRRIGAFLRRRPSSNRLLSFDEATEALGPWRQAFVGRRTVPVESIVGSEGRYADFDDEFLPLRGSSEEKWRSVYVALDAEVVELHAANPVEAPIFTPNLPEGRQHLHPSVRPSYGPPAAGGQRSDQSTRARRGRR